MRVCTVGQTQIRVSVGVLALLVFAAATQALGALLSSLWALALHEVCHALAARAMGYDLESFELLPFGAALKIRGVVESAAMAVIALAGPVGSLTAAMACAMASHYFPETERMLTPLLNANLLLAVFNLLPAQPLDGGRVFIAMLQRVISARKAASVGVCLGVVMGCILMGAAVFFGLNGSFSPTLLASGGLLIVYALRERRMKPLSYVPTTHRKSARLRQGGALRARVLAVDAGMSAGDALKLLSPSGFQLLLVMDERLHLLGRLGEGELMEGALRFGEDATLRKVLREI